MRRTKEDAEQTRLKVIAAALELFSRNGYSNTTLAMIAEAAGFSRGPIYWHFKSKDELYQAVLTISQEPLERLIARSRKLAKEPAAALEHFVNEWFRLLLDDRWYRQSFEILLNKTELTAQMASTLKRERKLTRDMVQLLEELIEQGQHMQVIQHCQPPRALALLLYSSLMGITHTWLLSPKLFSLREQAPFMASNLLALVTAVHIDTGQQTSRATEGV
ncbi:TetR family transcriptional regulator [Stutzerimonas stutzeri]|uniref:TetR family transcriptional regulator n=1 Tax=Stutzerimonas stutzeri TaxID=316 RepID=A0A2N8RIJ0_STUST|nr:TetR family transcriptional regulator [Stutzerimonas stutzeri]MCQ4252884.1 TetR family transcriptional regulator [Stutzerimonas stutzeri]MDH2245710.1 TetR family transcriptional regulator [Pseudomonas sp. GD03856]MDH2264600.1 TetR family transcriptional regulator [Pseudomonas sp. GD03855]PNF60878.1 TetR family transcriptional regulator [Stutzerimonas stutzeri]